MVLAVMLVVVFGASPASAHKGYKGLLHIGHKNVSGAVSTLVGKVASGSALVVENPSGGSALGLQVNAGKAPLTVNASAGKATNLDADKLDGKDASDFMTYNSTLKPGQTLTGIWGAGAGGTDTYAAATIEFRPKLPAALPNGNAHYVANGTSVPNCPGRGQADPGHLCVYETVRNGMSFEGFGDPVGGYAISVREQGTIAYFPSNISGRSWVRGTWAVTAPEVTPMFKQDLQEQPSRQTDNTATGQVPR